MPTPIVAYHSVMFLLHLLPFCLKFLLHLLNYSVNKWLQSIQILAIIAGFVAAYFRWFMGRIYHARLEAIISGTATRYKGSIYVTISSKMKNIGLSKFQLSKDPCILTIKASKPLSHFTKWSPPDWEDIGVASIFDGESLIESGETISDEALIVIEDKGWFALHLEAHVFSSKAKHWSFNIIIFPILTQRLRPAR